MPRHAWNKSSLDVKRRYFELIRQGLSGSAASQKVGVSLSCGSLWFIDAGSVDIVEKPINSRYLLRMIGSRLPRASWLASRLR